MNQFVNTLATKATKNGDPAFDTTSNLLVDVFFQIAAIRGQGANRVTQLVKPLITNDPVMAARMLLWVRDVRGGAGEREVFRQGYRDLIAMDVETAVKALKVIPTVGRWDDLITLMDIHTTVDIEILKMFSDALLAGNALCAKWTPRKGAFNNRLRGYMGLSPKSLRRILVSATNVVETQMCERQWSEIDYNKLPSVAFVQYRKAFARHDKERLGQHFEDIKNGKEGVKVNAGALYPYDILKVDRNQAQAFWDKLPDYVQEGVNFLPMIDVSSSMHCSAGSSNSVSCMDVATSLGIYVAERNKGIFKDLYLTFEDNPHLKKIEADHIYDRLHEVRRASWGGSTNLDKAFNRIIDHAVQNNVPQEDMPETVIVFSDMQFNSGGWGNNKPVSKRVKDAFEAAGYKMPNVVWWNIHASNNQFPVRAEEGNALVSGFSPSIMKNLFGGTLNPVTMVMNTIMNERYDF